MSIEPCTLCEDLVADDQARLYDLLPLCEDYARDLVLGEGVKDWLEFSDEALPAEQRYQELFKTARLLLKEGVDEEAQIVSTLAYANEFVPNSPFLRFSDRVSEKDRLVGAWEDGESWEDESNRFIRQYASLKPVRVVDGTLSLERIPLSILIHNHPDVKPEVPLELAPIG